MDIVDVVLVLVILVAAIHGLRVGALVQVLTFGGILAGITLGVVLAVSLLSSMHDQALRAGITIALVLGMASAGGTGGRVLGSWSHVTVRRLHLGRLDSALGVAVAATAVLVTGWLVANVFANSQYAWMNNAVGRSRILRTVDEILPPAPSVFAEAQSLLSSAGFPPVFVQLAPTIAGPVTPPSPTEATGIGLPASSSTVKVLGNACGQGLEGSGFVVGRGLVATNAHVVAGETQTQVDVDGAAFPATVVHYDPALDLAVLRTSAPLGPALAFEPGPVGRGTLAAVIGYPEDGPELIEPAGVAAQIGAEGRDIYDHGLVQRTIYEVDATIRPGNSGGPLVGTDGKVLGVVFSRSTTDPGVGYALASPAVASAIRSVGPGSGAVSTEACVAG